ncbi:MAG: hypothetical protein DRJ03_01355 [Chloroflexi bacterium]|nr:MAG: hypothetical protein DRJ03_01355 [Chloroflexota bacterium]
MPMACNWEQRYRIGYTFRTILQSNRKFHEQRRPTWDKPKRDVAYSVWEQGVNIQYARNLIKYGHDKFFMVPLFNEPIFSDRVHGLTGFDHVTADASLDIDHYYNLQNLCDFVMIIDHASLATEIKEIDSIVGNIITFTELVTGSFSEDSAMIYPAFVATIDGAIYTSETDDLDEIDLKFVEYIKSDR